MLALAALALSGCITLELPAREVTILTRLERGVVLAKIDRLERLLRISRQEGDRILIRDQLDKAYAELRSLSEE